MLDIQLLANTYCKRTSVTECWGQPRARFEWCSVPGCSVLAPAWLNVASAAQSVWHPAGCCWQSSLQTLSSCHCQLRMPACGSNAAPDAPPPRDRRRSVIIFPAVIHAAISQRIPRNLGNQREPADRTQAPIDPSVRAYISMSPAIPGKMVTLRLCHMASAPAGRHCRHTKCIAHIATRH